MTRVHAFTDDALGTDDAVGLRARLHRGGVSAAELVDAALARLAAVNPHLNGLAYDASGRARQEARHPRAGWFSGIPTFVKDNCDVAGMPTQQGTDAFVDPPRKADGDLARMFLGTGLVPLGKTRMSEFGFSPSAEHSRLKAVRSPWSTSHTAGASSSGSAAFVAAGVVPLAHANDGGGSIRIPAAVNGLVGLKPTRDRLASDALMRTMPVRIVADGVVTRTVRDTAAFLREAERVYRNPRLAPVGDVTRPSPRRLRVALVTVSPHVGVHDLAVDRARRVGALLESLGHHVEEVPPPVGPAFADDFLLYWSVLAAVLMRTGRLTHGRTWDPSRLSPLTRGLEAHLRTNLRHFAGATRRLRAARHESAAFYATGYDAVLSPTLATPTPEIGHLGPALDYDLLMERILDWVAFTPYQNASGDPAVSLPLETDDEGLPFGVQVSGPWGSEAMLLALAYELEEARPFRRIDAA